MRIPSYLARPEIGFDLFRIYLGIGLVVRGGLVASDPTVLDQFIGNRDWLFPMLTAHFVVLSHVVGGLLLALGYCTRWAAGLQIPTVAGALIFVHWREGLFARTQSTELAMLVLVALVLYAVFGAGALSVDRQAERMRAWAAGRRVQPLVPDAADAPHLPAERTRDIYDEPADDAAISVDIPPPEPPRARMLYRDNKLELGVVGSVVIVLVVLLAKELYVAATAWMIVSLFMFGIWRVGRAEFQ